MKSLMCERHGPPEALALREVPVPTPKAGEILIRVAATSLNFPDLLMLEGKYQVRPPLPFAPGMEVAGEVAALGSGVSLFGVGDRVMGWCNWGGCAEYVTARADEVVAIPETLNWIDAAGFLLTYATSYHALVDRAAIGKGESLLVLGAGGGVGLSAVTLGKALGARVVAAASDETKLALAREAGAEATIMYPRGAMDRAACRALTARFKEALGDDGADVIYDPVGGDYSEPALRAIAWSGRYLVVGFAAGAIARPPWNLALLKGCAILGINWAEFIARERKAHTTNATRLTDWLVAGRLRSWVSQIWPLTEGQAALRSMMDRRAHGKLVVYAPFAEQDAQQWHARQGGH